MITFVRIDGKMPKCGRCKTTMKYWDLRNDESTYRCDSCEDIERKEFWTGLVSKMFQDAKEKVQQQNGSKNN